MHITILLRAAGALLVGAQLMGLAAAQTADLLAPVRILADGKPIDVTTGHAAPYVRDFDGDGVRDLLVGEFGDGKFPAAELPDALDDAWKQGDNFVHGRLRIYKNHGTNKKPRFEGFEYLRAGGGIASIPMT